MPKAVRSLPRFAPEPIFPATRDALARFFPGWRGDAPEPALPSPIINRPAPAAARALVLA